MTLDDVFPYDNFHANGRFQSILKRENPKLSLKRVNSGSDDRDSGVVLPDALPPKKPTERTNFLFRNDHYFL